MTLLNGPTKASFEVRPSTGQAANSKTRAAEPTYPRRDMSSPDCGWRVVRRIEPGTFDLGEPATIVPGGNHSRRPERSAAEWPTWAASWPNQAASGPCPPTERRKQGSRRVEYPCPAGATPRRKGNLLPRPRENRGQTPAGRLLARRGPRSPTRERNPRLRATLSDRPTLSDRLHDLSCAAAAATLLRPCVPRQRVPHAFRRTQPAGNGRSTRRS